MKILKPRGCTIADPGCILAGGTPGGDPGCDLAGRNCGGSGGGDPFPGGNGSGQG